ncbi:MAG: universal stress protein [Ignavibacteria bacterium]|nr:universal stress protein [Ignavibacteria bacterium]
MDFHISKILVPTDFSENSKFAIRYAIQFAQKFNSEITLIYVIEPIIYPSDFGLGQVPIGVTDVGIHKRAEEELKKLIDTMFPPNIKTKYVVKTGKPFLEIIHTAQDGEFDLIIISSHGHSGFEQILFGSTAEKVVRKSAVPVLSIRSVNNNAGS